MFTLENVTSSKISCTLKFLNQAYAVSPLFFAMLPIMVSLWLSVCENRKSALRVSATNNLSSPYEIECMIVKFMNLEYFNLEYLNVDNLSCQYEVECMNVELLAVVLLTVFA